ncbi:tRNA-splicing ligase RtcB-domain-containing protein [Dendryphion nanum]|uniref:3'-phosphate/5'-hydroxy nucleic acid ligase n=1 Tax=Dendryphion nanum TaxID=256645 RepID=A0A9P9E4J8_9PLEO|nr:tRNA-splicing ligase RtcB-domain-containing protein [Dendryphion nanum]
MPATRITVALNANRTQKTPLLVPASASLDPSALNSIHTLVFNTARSKLRLKKPKRIFVASLGTELLAEQDWRDTLKDDVIFLVSAGEEYIGLRKENNPDANPDCPVYVLAQDAPVDELAIAQLKSTAQELPGMVLATGQPDLCPGTKYPVGAVFVSQNWIHPPLIGSDIGCGMAWYKTKLSRHQVEGERGKRIAEKLQGLEGPWRTSVDRENWLQDKSGNCSAGKEWDASVGTIGRGNHFAEIQVVESIELAEQEKIGLRPDDVILLVHSGSRGYGADILKKYTAGSHVSLKEGNESMRLYMAEHDQAIRWAKANRDLIAVRFLACLEPGEEAWQSGRNAPTNGATIDSSIISQTKAMIRERRVVDISHNNVERVKWPPSSQAQSAPAQPMVEEVADIPTIAMYGKDDDETKQNYVYIHRKGAAPTWDAHTDVPLSILPLPGSRGTPTLMLKPTFSGHTNWGRNNALSLAHGSGRSMSRNKALSSLSAKYKKSSALLERSSRGGTWVICDEKDLVYEEAPEAYKDVYAVGRDLEHEEAARIVGLCEPRISYKVRDYIDFEMR